VAEVLVPIKIFTRKLIGRSRGGKNPLQTPKDSIHFPNSGSCQVVKPQYVTPAGMPSFPPKTSANCPNCCTGKSQRMASLFFPGCYPSTPCNWP